MAGVGGCFQKQEKLLSQGALGKAEAHQQEGPVQVQRGRVEPQSESQGQESGAEHGDH